MSSDSFNTFMAGMGYPLGGLVVNGKRFTRIDNSVCR